MDWGSRFPNHVKSRGLATAAVSMVRGPRTSLCGPGSALCQAGRPAGLWLRGPQLLSPRVPLRCRALGSSTRALVLSYSSVQRIEALLPLRVSFGALQSRRARESARSPRTREHPEGHRAPSGAKGGELRAERLPLRGDPEPNRMQIHQDWRFAPGRSFSLPETQSTSLLH